MLPHPPVQCALPRILTFTLAVAAFMTAFHHAEATTYTLARAPQMSAIALVDAWTPFLERLSKDTGITITLKVYQSRQTFEGDLFNGAPDFAFMNPYYAVLAKKRLGYAPLVRDGSETLRGIIVVRHDSPIQSLQDLEGATIAFPDPNAMAASLYPRAILTSEMGLSFNAQYVGAHENVYRSVYLRQVDAGGGVNKTFAGEPDELRAQLRVIWQTPDLPSHPLIVHPRVPSAVRDKVTAAILSMANDDQGRALLEKVNLGVPVAVDFQRDFGHIETLGLEKYTVELGR